MSEWPRQLIAATGPMRAEKIDGAADGMGEWGQETRALVAQGWVPPDMMTGLTLFLLSSQPRDPTRQKIPGGGGGVAGGVWVRERFTIHRGLRREEQFTVSGTAVGRHVHKGRRYGTNECTTLGEDGEKAARNITTGLLAYKVEAGLADHLEGQDPDALESPAPDWQRAASNPSLERLRALREGQVLGDYPVRVSLAMMEARDTKNPDNPIHSDPELARKAGLTKPIAGGSHVLAFPLEAILAEIGRHGLYYGASFDIRWRTPVYADTTIIPRVLVESVAPQQVVFGVKAILPGDNGAEETAMVGQVTVPLA